MPQMLKNKLRISAIQEEIKLLRSFIIGIIGKDKEGEYNPSLVNDVLKSSKEKPQYKFKGKHSFLKQILKN